MGFSCGCFPAPNMGGCNRNLFTITGSAFNIPYMGNSIMGGNIGHCGNGSIFNGGFRPTAFGGFGNPFAGFGGNIGGFGNPFGCFGGNFGGFGGGFGGFRFPFF